MNGEWVSWVVEVRLSTFPLFYFAYVSVNVGSVCHYCWGERCWSYLWSRSDWHSFVIIIPNMMMGSLSLFTFTCMRTSLLLHVNCTSTQYQACTWWVSGQMMQSFNIIVTWVLSSVCSSVQRNLEAYQPSITCTGLVHVVDGLTVFVMLLVSLSLISYVFILLNTGHCSTPIDHCNTSWLPQFHRQTSCKCEMLKWRVQSHAQWVSADA